MLIENIHPSRWDEKREVIVPGDYQMTLVFCVEHWIAQAKAAIKDHGAFYVALSGGSTPKAIFELLSASPYNEMVEWEKVHIFWSDERSVPPHHSESNYHMALTAGLDKMPIPKNQIHRMVAEEHIEENARLYEKKMTEILQGKGLDFIMLGMGDDGHTASLFPHTQGINAINHKVIANFIPEKNTWRMTFTFDWINAATHTAIYVLGAAKKFTLSKVLLSPAEIEQFPVLKVGTPARPALFIVDEAAAAELITQKQKLKKP